MAIKPSGGPYDRLSPRDIVLVSLGEPRRGDVVTFTSPRDDMRLIKRLQRDHLQMETRWQEARKVLDAVAAGRVGIFAAGARRVREADQAVRQIHAAAKDAP